MAKRDWESLLPYLGLGGLVLAAGRGSADPDPPDDGNGDDPDDPGDDPDDPDDPGPNEGPSVSITAMVERTDRVTANADASDPDGTIESIEWEVLHSDGSIIGRDSGQSCSIDLSIGGEQTLHVEVTDDRGATAQDSQVFIWDPPGDGSDNEQPTVSIVDLSVSDGQVHVGADGNDPDGQIVSYTWELERDGTVVDTASSQSATLDLDGPGDYVTRVTAEDDGGKTGSDTYTFTVEGNGGGGTPDFDNKLTFSKRTDPWATYQDTYLLFSSTGELQASGDIASGEWSQQGGTAEPVMTGSDSVTVQYNGDIDYLDWSGGPFTLYQNDNRVDPWELGDGPRYTWTGGTSDVIETTVYQTHKQYARQGLASADTCAMWLSETLKEHDISHDIIYSTPVMKIPSERTGCTNPLSLDDPCWGDDSCSDWDCCAQEDFMPHAYYWWRSDLNEGGWQDRFRNASGTDLKSRGDSYVMRKDSNVLLTDRTRGGCGAVGGSQCVIGADAIGDMSYDPSAGTSRANNQIHNVLHEFGHNMGFGHPPYDDTCPEGGGDAWVDGLGRWNRYPCVPGHGCENRCGFEIEPRSNATSNTVVHHPTFTQCTADQFKSNMGPPEGSVRQVDVGVYVDEDYGEEVKDCGCGCDGC